MRPKKPNSVTVDASQKTEWLCHTKSLWNFFRSTYTVMIRVLFATLIFYLSFYTFLHAVSLNSYLFEGTRHFSISSHFDNPLDLFDIPSVVSSPWNFQSDYDSDTTYFSDSSDIMSLSVGSFSSDEQTPFDGGVFGSLLASQKTFLQKHKHVIKLLEDIGLFSYQFSRSRSKADMLAAATVFLKLRTSKSILLSSSELLTNKLEELFDIDCYNLQSLEEYVTTGRSSLESASRIRQSRVVKKFECFLMYCLSFGALDIIGINFDALGYSKVEKAYIKRKHSVSGGFVYDVLDMILFLCETGVQLANGATPGEIIHGFDTYDKFMTNFRQLKEEARVVAEGKTQSEFYRGDVKLADDLAKAVIEVKQMTEKAALIGKSEYNTMRELQYEVIALFDTVNQRVLANKARRAPFGTLVFGDTSIGKSSFMNILFQSYGRIRDLPCTDDYLFKRDPTSDYWDGFDSSKWCVILDDIGFRRPEKVESDHSVDELISIINNIPFMPNQAAIEKKGKTPMLSEFVIGSTNTRDMNARHYFSFPKAVWRRLPLVVHLSVKSEFSSSSGSLEVPPSYEGPPDYWIYRVETTKVTGGVLQPPVFQTFTRMSDFLVFFRAQVLEHNRVQDAMLKSGENLRASETCTECGIMSMFCACDAPNQVMETQSAFVPFAFFFGMYFRTLLLRIYDFLVLRAVDTCVASMQEYIMYNYGTLQNKIAIIGRRVSRRVYRKPVHLLAFVGVLGCLLLLYKRTQPFTSQSENENVPIPLPNERPNVYADTWRAPSNFVSLKSASTHESHLKSRVSLNTCNLSFHVEDGTHRAKGLVVDSNCVLMNRHLFKGEALSIDITFGKTGSVQEALYQIPLNSIEYTEDVDRDLVLMRVPSLRPFRSLIDHFVDESVRGSANGYYLVRNDAGEVKKHDVGRVSLTDVAVADFDAKLPCLVGSPSVPTVKGMCGAPLLIQCGSHSLIGGIHAVGAVGTMFSRSSCGASVVTRQTVQNMLNKLTQTNVSASGPNIECESRTYTVQSLHPKSVFRYMDGCATIYGSFSGFKSSPSSKVVTTPLRDKYLSLGGIDPGFGPPVMKGYKPWRLAALQLTDPVKSFAQEDIDWAVKDYWTSLVDSGVDFSTVEKYDLNVAVNGAPGVAYVDSINRNSSAGFPWRTSKRAHFESIPSFGGYQDPVEPSAEIYNRVALIEDKYARGELYHPVFVASLKDEPVSAKKQASGKTRVFCGAPIDWSLVVRKFCLGHVRTIQNNKVAFECAVGTVAQSAEWGVLHDHVIKFGDQRIVAGDYSAFDKRMPAALILAAFDILIKMSEASGNFDAEDLRVLHCIAMDTAYPVVDYNGDLVQFWGSNPSGHPLTVIINSIVNSLYMRVAYHNLVGGDRPFRSDVALLTYGDDNIMSVRSGVPFGHTAISGFFKTLGIGYTMADKEAESQPFISLCDASFLKRKWQYDDEVGGYLAPLEEQSIHKMLTTTVASTSITMEEQCSEVIRAAHSEYFFYGREVFTRKTTLLKELIEETGLTSWFLDQPLPTWELLLKRWRDSSEKIGLPQGERP